MGINKACCHLFLEEQKAGNFHGKILQLGRQYILFDHSFLKESAGKHQCKLNSLDQIELSFDAGLQEKGYLNDTSFFKALGFDHVDSLDYSAYEEASIIWDMNQPIPEKYWGQYDVVFDGGTAEHVFHFPQFVENIYRMLKPEGTVIHLSPSHNHVDHGFYMFSPTIYYEYYLANQFKIVTSLILESFKRCKSIQVYSYHPGCLSKFDCGGFGKQILDIFFVAKKTEKSTCGVIPQQLSNQEIWSREPVAAAKKKKKSVLSKIWRNTYKRLAKSLIPSSSCKMPPKIAKY